MNNLKFLLILAIAITAPFSQALEFPALINQAQPPLKSYRLIIKFRADRIAPGMTAAQALTELRKPLTQDTLNRLQSAAGMSVSESHALSDGAHVILLPDGTSKLSMQKAVQAIQQLGEIEYVEEDRILTPLLTPNDTYYANLWGMRPVTPASSLPSAGADGSYGADFQTAWDTTTGLNSIVVAVVDTGVVTHADLTANLVSTGYTFISDCRIRGSTATNGCASTASNTSPAPTADATDTGDFLDDTADCKTLGSVFYGCTAKNSSWHGTHVAGTVAAVGNNATGVVGGAYNARILPVRVLGKGGGYTSDIAEGVRWAAGIHGSINNPNPAKVINLSLGGSGACGATEQSAINAAVAAGAVLVIAAGNSNKDVSGSSPANCENVIRVASIMKDGSRAAYSNFSSPSSNTSNPVQVSLAAQGAEIYPYPLGTFDPGIRSTVNSSTTTPAASPGGDSYAYYQGTSMAAPHVAAAAALMLSRTVTLTPAQIKAILVSSTTTFPSFSSASWASYDCATKGNCGAGILNAKLAVQNSVSPLTPSATTLDFGTVNVIASPAPTSNLTLTLTNSSGSAVTMGTAALYGAQASAFAISSNTCTTINNGSTCQVVVSYTPTHRAHEAALFIPVSPATSGAVAILLKGNATINLTPSTAIAATRSGTSSGGGCSILFAPGTPDLTLPLTLLVLLTYRLRHRADHIARQA